ncbi:MAG TPA: di-heme-cytochrome C peroxidase [Bryobacteraceae bacterium]|nr:di-heme-cytochrome C peroxidase [Bryobacteraceae bacterium]
MKSSPRRVLALLVAVMPLAGQSQNRLNQGWSAQRSKEFWHEDQGSMMMPLNWFLKLRTKDGSKPFSSDLERFGFIPDPDKNQLPIGFAVHNDKATGRSWIGLTCSACHTGRIRYRDRAMIIEGAPSLLDFDSFFASVVDAMDRYTPGPDEARQFADLKGKLRSRLNFNKTSIYGGFGRVDAFGQIFNDIAVVVLKNGDSAARPPDSPASYPLLWDIAQHKRVQWNGSAPNLGVGGDGSMMRNIGEVIGVFGQVTIPDKFSGMPKFQSSAALPKLRMLESWISELHSPQWPGAFPPLREAMVSRGEIIYRSECQRCHALLADTRNIPNPLPTSLISINEVQTDRKLLDNFNKFTTNSRQLQGHLTLLNPRRIWTTFQPTDSVALITAYITAGVLNGEDPKGTHRVRDALALFWEGTPDMYAYKARPLNGVWATAPYLHNGSVPNLEELLKEPKERAAAFCVGTAEFDPAIVGYPALSDPSRSCGAQFKLDTSLPGNRNIGHNYGTRLSLKDKHALVEFVKSL